MGSYGAMLRSYAKRSKPQGSAAASGEGYAPEDHPEEEENAPGYVLGTDAEYGQSGYDLNLALSLNYEVRLRVLWHASYVCLCTCCACERESSTSLLLWIFPRSYTMYHMCLTLM